MKLTLSLGRAAARSADCPAFEPPDQPSAVARSGAPRSASRLAQVLVALLMLLSWLPQVPDAVADAAVEAGAGAVNASPHTAPDAPTNAPALPRVVSTNLCADLVLLEVAAPGQILALSRESQIPSLSPVAGKVAYPTNGATVEELLHLDPDIALTYPGWTGRRHGELLAARGIQVVTVPYPRHWDDAVAATRKVAAAIGRDAAGEARVRDVERRRQALAGSLPPYRVLYLRPNGGTAGAGTYVDAVFSLLGLRNFAVEQGRNGWGSVALEQLVMAPPELFLLGYFDSEQPISGSGHARHPLMRALLERTPAIKAPDNLWGCGGLEVIAAAEIIAARVKALDATAP